MNDQSPINEPEPLDRDEARRERRAERHANSSHTGTWVTGVVLIVLGALFLLRNTGIFNISLRNWWALFILIPAVGAFERALYMYRSSGNQLTAPVSGSLVVGSLLTFITVMFLFDISWTFFGPILLILLGIAVIFNYTLRQK